MSSKHLPRALVIAVAASLSGAAAQAQVTSPKIVITNTTPAAVELPLNTTSTVDISANGDLRVECRLVDGVCPGLGSGGGSTGTNPPASVTLTPSVLTLDAGQAFSLTWGSGTGTEACYGAGPSGVSNWSGTALGVSGTRSLTLAQGTYSFQIRCYNASGSTTTTAATVTVNAAVAPPPPADYCGEFYNGTTRAVPTGSAFTAHGFTRVDKPFVEIWGIQAGDASTTRVGVPGPMLDPSTNRYLSIPFVMTDGSGGPLSQFGLDWIESNFNLGVVTGAISLSISPCPGDFRPQVFNSTDPYLSQSCRKDSSSVTGTLYVSSVSGLSGCPAPINKQMYINIATYNMFQSSPPTVNSCGTSSSCGVSMIVN